MTSVIRAIAVAGQMAAAPISAHLLGIERHVLQIPPGVLIALLAVFGVLYLFLGLRLYRIALVVVIVVAGGLAGLLIAHRHGVPALPVAFAAAIVVGLLSRRVERLGAFFLGAVVGALLMNHATPWFTNVHSYYFAALLVCIAAGSVAVLVFEPALILITAVIGAACLYRAAALTIISLRPAQAESWLESHAGLQVVAFCIAVVVGVLVQSLGRGGPPPDEDEEEATRARREPKKKRAT